MKTADFLPAEAFNAHLERRRTPRRAAILCGFAVLCLSLSQAFAWNSHGLQGQALDAEQPDEDALVAGAQLNGVYREMSYYADRLDPLCQHLSAPTSGWLLAGISAAAGEDVSIQKVKWSYDAKNMSVIGQADPQLDLIITCQVNGDQALLELPRRLRDFTAYESASTGHVEVVKDNADALRVDILLKGNNVLLESIGAKQ